MARPRIGNIHFRQRYTILHLFSGPLQGQPGTSAIPFGNQHRLRVAGEPGAFSRLRFDINL